ncbi:MAG: GNAT family N-acetyltransferase [Crocinitomicaceae bacterium]
MNYISEKLSENNLNQLAWLFEQEHGSKFSLEYFKRKFNTDWTGKKHIGFFAKDEENQVGAFYGGFPCQLKVDDEKILVLQSGDTITHANHRKKGLFIRLAEETYQYAESEGFDYVFGFPNKNSEHGFFQKLGWENLGSSTDFTFTFSNFNWFGLCHKFTFLKRFYESFWRKQEARYSISPYELFKDYKHSYNGVRKDSNFLQYKLNYGNSKLVKIDNKIFWIKKDNGIRLGEIFQRNEEIDIYSYLKPLAKAFGVRRIHFSCNEHHPMFNVLSMSNAQQSSGHVAGIRGLKNKFLPNNLAFVSGDSDDF